MCRHAVAKSFFYEYRKINHACTGRTPGTSHLFKRQTVNLSSSCETSQSIFLKNRGEICFFPVTARQTILGFWPVRAHTFQPLSLVFTLHGALKRAEGRCNVLAGPYKPERLSTLGEYLSYHPLYH